MSKPDKTEEKRRNYITQSGFQNLRREYAALLKEERPKLVKVIEWAAGNGDRSENADYIYGKRRLREIDRRLHFLEKRLQSAVVVKVGDQKNQEKVFFGARVTVEDEEGEVFTYQIVGEDEIDTQSGKISWISPFGRALLGKKIDDEIIVDRPKGKKTYVISKILYAEEVS